MMYSYETNITLVGFVSSFGYFLLFTWSKICRNHFVSSTKWNTKKSVYRINQYLYRIYLVSSTSYTPRSTSNPLTLVVYLGFNTCFVLFLFNDLTTAVGTSSADNGYDPPPILLTLWNGVTYSKIWFGVAAGVWKKHPHSYIPSAWKL